MSAILLQTLRARGEGRACRQTRGLRKSGRREAGERLSRSTPKTLTRTEPRGEIPVHAGVCSRASPKNPGHGVRAGVQLKEAPSDWGNRKGPERWRSDPL